MYHRRVRIVLEFVQRPQPEPDVLERDGLQLASSSKLGLVQRERSLCRLAFPAELIQVPRPVEILDRGDPPGVRVSAQIAPALKAAQGLVDLLLRDRVRRGVPAHRLDDILGSQVDDEALLGRDEHGHNPPVQRRVRDIQVREWPRARLEPADRLRLGADRDCSRT